MFLQSLHTTWEPVAYVDQSERVNRYARFMV